MAIFKLYECDFGIDLNGVHYEFTHVHGLQIEDPERNRIVRGGNAGNKLGIVYKEGIKDPKKITLTILDVSVAIHTLLKTAFDDQTRMDCYCVNRKNGSTKIAKNSILCQEPKQLTVDENPESMNVVLEFESFDVSENPKD